MSFRRFAAAFGLGMSLTATASTTAAVSVTQRIDRCDTGFVPASRSEIAASVAVDPKRHPVASANAPTPTTLIHPTSHMVIFDQGRTPTCTAYAVAGCLEIIWPRCDPAPLELFLRAKSLSAAEMQGGESMGSYRFLFGASGVETVGDDVDDDDDEFQRRAALSDLGFMRQHLFRVTPSVFAEFAKERQGRGVPATDTFGPRRDYRGTLNALRSFVTSRPSLKTFSPDVAFLDNGAPDYKQFDQRGRLLHSVFLTSYDEASFVAILKKVPFVAAMRVTDRWGDVAPPDGGVLPPIDAGPSDRLTGAHAVAVVGYSAPRRSFLILNSWGPTWDKRGLRWVTSDYLEKYFMQGLVLLPEPESSRGARTAFGTHGDVVEATTRVMRTLLSELPNRAAFAAE